MYCGATGDWTVGSCESISKMLGGAVFSSVDGERSRSLDTHFRHIEQWLKVILTMSAKTRVHLILGSRKTLMSTMPRECWNCRVCQWAAEQNSFKRLARRILCWCGLLNCGNAGSCYRGDVGAVYQRVFSASHSRTFVSISTSTR